MRRAQAEAIWLILKGHSLAPVESVFTLERSPHHGHVQAVQAAMTRLGFADLVASRRSWQRDVVIAIMVVRVLKPESNLATPRWWKTTTLSDVTRVTEARAEDVYAALGGLLARQERIEAKLAARHLQAGGVVLDDLTSNYLEGTTGLFAARGYNWDGKRGTLQVN